VFAIIKPPALYARNTPASPTPARSGTGVRGTSRGVARTIAAFFLTVLDHAGSIARRFVGTPPLHPEPAIIPAKFGHEAGMWFGITTGIQGIVIRGPMRGYVVYMLTTDATNYYKNMTKQNSRMPVLISQVI